MKILKSGKGCNLMLKYFEPDFFEMLSFLVKESFLLSRVWSPFFISRVEKNIVNKKEITKALTKGVPLLWNAYLKWFLNYTPYVMVAAEMCYTEREHSKYKYCS